MGLLIFSPILVLVIIMNILFQGFPILFLQKRSGKKGTPFTLMKFRTMTIGPSISASHDITRLTSWGRLLRWTSIDELPVLFNVLKGEMSLVGPRPLPIKSLPRFNQFQKKRLNIIKVWIYYLQ